MTNNLDPRKVIAQAGPWNKASDACVAYCFIHNGWIAHHFESKSQAIAYVKNNSGSGFVLAYPSARVVCHTPDCIERSTEESRLRARLWKKNSDQTARRVGQAGPWNKDKPKPRGETFKVGERVYWFDSAEEENQSGWGVIQTITAINNHEVNSVVAPAKGQEIDVSTVVFLELDDGGFMEVAPHELRHKEPKWSREGQAGPWNNKPKMKTLEVWGRRWFQRGPGNTYHTVQIVIDSRSVWKSGITYGYGDAYEQTAAAWLEQNGYLKLERYGNGGGEQLWRYCQDHGIQYMKCPVDVQRRRDL